MAKENGWKFGWKRKAGAAVSKTASTAFENESHDETVDDDEVDWLSLLPIKKKAIGLEDAVSKSNRLVQEGATLAEAERYWEALKKWDEALQYTPCEAKLHEMKAQALMALCEVYPAVKAAQKATEFGPTWWIAHQTLGRALLGLGEVHQALRCFSVAVHLNPGNEELWEEDLRWAFSLLQKRQVLDEEKQRETENLEARSSLTITELDSGEGVEEEREGGEDVELKTVDVYKRPPESVLKDSENTSPNRTKHRGKQKRVPNNFVQMRDKIPQVQ